MVKEEMKLVIYRGYIDYGLSKNWGDLFEMWQDYSLVYAILRRELFYKISIPLIGRSRQHTLYRALDGDFKGS